MGIFFKKEMEKIFPRGPRIFDGRSEVKAMIIPPSTPDIIGRIRFRKILDKVIGTMPRIIPDRINFDETKAPDLAENLIVHIRDIE